MPRKKPQSLVPYNAKDLDIAGLTADLIAYRREPFLDILRLALSNSPTEDSISSLTPTQWADYTTKVAKLYGYTEQSSVLHTHKLITEMTTEEISAEISSLDAKQASIDADYTIVDKPTI